MKAALNDAKSVLPSRLRTKKPLTYFIVPEVYPHSRYEYSNRLAYSFQPPREYPLLGSAVLIHEHGHAVFADRIADFVPSLKPHYSRMLLRQALGRTHRHYDIDRKYNVERMKEAARRGQTREAGRLRRQLASDDADHSRYQALMRALPLDKATNKLLLPYDELWADTLSVVSMKNLDVMQYLPGNRARGMARSFSRYLDCSRWTETEPHIMFSPVRSFLGNTYLRNVNTMTRQQRSGFLNSFFEALGEEISTRKVGDNLSVPVLNARLILRVHGKLARGVIGRSAPARGVASLLPSARTPGLSRLPVHRRPWAQGSRPSPMPHLR
jgi:hypothetical protein